MTKQITTTIVVAVIVAAAGFFGGMKYGQSKSSGQPGQTNNRQGGGFGNGRRFGNGNNFVNGTILTKDNGTLTVQLRAMPGNATSTSSGSKLVILSGNTQIFKSVQGTPDDLTAGQNITATGVDNSSGAMTAQTVQIRQMPPPGQQQPGR